MFCDYQINLGNNINTKSSLKGERGGGGGEIFNISRKGVETYMGGLAILFGDVITT